MERDEKHKLNRYKRKLKKYMALNENQAKQIHMLKKAQSDQYQSERCEKSIKIAQLTRDNMKLIQELKDRDEAQATLEEKLEYVDSEISKLGTQLKDQGRLNQKLKRELKKYRNQENQEAQELREILQLKDQQIEEKDQHIKYLQDTVKASQKREKRSEKHLKQQLQEMSMRMQALEKMNFDLQNVRAHTEHQQPLSGKSITDCSMSRMGPINLTTDRANMVRQSGEDSQMLSFQPSLRQLERFMQ